MNACTTDQVPRKLNDTYIVKWIALQSQNSSYDSCDRLCLLLLPLPIPYSAPIRTPLVIP